ncbi:MAG: hypothetical protein FWC62_07045 [Firmicutes bacterium]|nr:hypothetical protein [Bacillota bacterium]
MKRTHKALFSLLIAVCLAFSCFISVFATEAESSEVPIKATAENADQILLDFGMDSDFVAGMAVNEKIDLAQAVLTNPETVGYITTRSESDEVSVIEWVVNSTDVQLLQSGMNKDDLKMYRKTINDLQKMTFKELKDKYGKGRSDEAIKMVMMALKPNKDYTNKKVDSNVVTSSGDIASTQLSLTRTVYDNRTTTGKPVSFRASVNYNWIQMPFFFLNDEIAIAWGGSLDVTDIYRTDIYQWTDNAGLHSVTLSASGTTSAYDCLGKVSSTAVISNNIGLLCKHQEAENNGMGTAKCGYVYATLYKNTSNTNFATKILAQYGHRVPAVTNTSLSFKSGPAITLGTGMDYSQQIYYNITV